MLKVNFKVRMLLILGLTSIHAVSLAQDFEVAPVRLEFDAEPATSQIKTISVKNHSSRKVSYTIALADFLPSSLGEKKTLPPNSTKRSCANWINVNPSFFELNPGDDIQLQVTMLVPGEEYNAAWCMLYIQPTREQTSWSADKTLGAGIAVTGRIGVQVYQSPRSNSNQSLKISNLVEITNPGEPERKFTATLENLGDKISTCKVFLLASNMITTEEKQFSVQEYEIFPKMSRSIELVLPNDLQPGTYALAAIVDYGPKFPLEGAQIVIEVKGDSKAVAPDTVIGKP
ncbi:MAG: hypothetical protein AB7S54_08155 [Bacteroidales bacterium]